MDKCDCIIVGAGFCGSVIARKIAEQGKKVLILERRNHIAGNMYDEIDSNGILVQRYGPHIFHTNSKEVYEFITRYDAWNNFHHKPAVEMNGIVTPAPANFTTIDLLYSKEEAEVLKTSLETRYPGKKNVTILELLECDDKVIKEYAKKLYELNYQPYTAKQWGIPLEEVDPNVLKRVPIRLDYIDGYFDDEFQCMPEKSYTHFFKNLLDHENIQVMLDTDALDMLEVIPEKGQVLFKNKPISVPVVYTGAIDELLDYKYGQLPYRSLRFDYHTKNVDSFQEASVVAYPKAEGYTRITEFKKLPPQNVKGRTTIAYEYPLPADKESNEPYYPISTDENLSLYNKYKSDIKKIPNVFLCGRLADYKYYNMDAAILQAFDVCEAVKTKIKKNEEMMKVKGEKPIISIIIPCYNMEEYIAQCIHSVIKQSLKDIEIICINDGSKDRTLEILREFEAADPRVKVLDLTNGGYGRAVNNGIAAAKGEYIGIVESDDFISKSMYETLYSLSFEGTVDIVKGNFWDYYELPGNKQELVTNNERSKMPAVNGSFTIRERPEILSGHPCVWSAIYRRDFLQENKIQFIEAKGGGWVDNPFFFETLCKAKKVMWTNEPLYYYRKTNPNSSSNKVETSLPFVRMIDNLDVLERNGCTDNEIKKIAYNRALIYLRGSFKDCDYDKNFNAINAYAKQVMQRLDPDTIESEFNLKDQATFFEFASPIKCISSEFPKILIYDWIPYDNSWGYGGSVNRYCKNLINTILKENPKVSVYFLSSGFAYRSNTTEIYIEKIFSTYGDRCHQFEIINSPVPVPMQQPHIWRNPLAALENPEIKGVFAKFLANYGPFEAIHFNTMKGLSFDVLDLKQEHPGTKFIFSFHNYTPVCLNGSYYQRHNSRNCNPEHTEEDCYKCIQAEDIDDIAVEIYKRGIQPIDPKTAMIQDNWIDALDLERLDEEVQPDRIFDFAKTFTAKINQNCDHILAVSQKVYDIAEANGVNNDKMEVSYIGTAIANEQLRRSSALPKPDSGLKIVFLGDDLNSKEKGYPFLLDALTSLSDMYASQIDIMLTVKQGNHAILYEKLKNFRSVTIRQGYENKDLRKILAGCHLGIIPVIWEEHLPQIAMEMAAYGVPVLSSSFGGASELCTSALFKFEGGDKYDFLNKLIHFVENPEDLEEYWKHHTGLRTMSEHWEELAEYYGLQKDKSFVELSSQDYRFLLMENYFLRKNISFTSENLVLQDRLKAVEHAAQYANEAEQRAIGFENWAKNAEQRAIDFENWAKSAEQRAIGFENWARDAEHRAKEVSHFYDLMQNSASFKFGRLVTLLPRKIRDLFREKKR